jgi:RNA polymerase sigma-70 factor (ECF subfamily)
LARNRGIDCLRSKRSRERTLARVKLGLWNTEPEGPEQQALRREEIESLLSVFATLPLSDRQLILMKDVDDFSIGEIADILSVPAGTVKSRLHRAREKLLANARRAR